MTPYIKESIPGGLRIAGVGNYSPEKTFDCGQCFRFDPVASGGIGGIAHGRRIQLCRDGDELVLIGADAESFEAVWRHYLALDTEYGEIDRAIVAAVEDERSRGIIERAVSVSGGIRILRQDPWEALCSFIISQNNNIPRIKKLVEALCRLCGDRIGDDDYAFPDAKAVLDAGEERIFALRTGFRAKYIIDAARRTEDGGLFAAVRAAKSYDEADALLRTISGVGPKVSACTLLFGFERTDAFPIDVWIRRVMEKYFPVGFDPGVWGKHAGIAQQYLFYYERYVRESEDFSGGAPNHKEKNNA